MKKFILLTFILAILALFSTTAFAAVEKPISFLQDDSKWGSMSYSITGSQSQTIASSGCGPTAMAMVLHYYGEEVLKECGAVDSMAIPHSTNTDSSIRYDSSSSNDCPCVFHDSYVVVLDYRQIFSLES